MNKPKEKPKPKPRPIKMELTSMDIVTQKRAELTALLKTRFPELVREDGVNFDQLKRTLGENVEGDKERFGLQWHGKTECMRIIQQPSIATLKPARDESSDFDKTENLFIEGDNLEVLKLLQKSYFGKVKMIYIDPPYNTGKEFIYPDKYAETLDTYLKYTGQKDSEGRKFSTNTETTGRYHSNWLNMMYPRLYLAHNLLRDDGVIFISIDDNEQANLKLLCDEIFGEDNFVETFIWKKKGGAGNTESYIGDLVEYIVMYTKNISDLTLNRRLIEGVDYPHKDSEGIYRLEPLTKTDSGTYQRNTMKFSVTNPNNKQEVFPPEGRRWIVGKNTMNDLLEAGLLIFMLDTNGNFNIKKKDYYNNMDPRNGVYLNLLVEKGSLKTAKDELGKLDSRESFLIHQNQVY